MENYFVEATDYTPGINFEGQTGNLTISGDCYHEYVTPFFHPLFDWLKRFLTEPSKNVTLNFRLEYFNTSASRRFQEMIDMLEDYQLKKKGKVTINWYYDKNNVDAYDSGIDFSKGIKVKFNLISM